MIDRRKEFKKRMWSQGRVLDTQITREFSNEQFIENMNKKPLNVIKASCPEFYEWLKEISRYSKVEDFVLPDYKKGIRVYLFTKENRYSIKVEVPAPNNNESENNNYGYLGCVVTSRKPRAGEDWNRGNDLSDGKYCYETWQKIKNDIVSYELVKIIKSEDRE